jgi:hypothetical protein
VANSHQPFIANLLKTEGENFINWRGYKADALLWTGISKRGDRFLAFVGKNELCETGIAFVSTETDLLAYPRIESFSAGDAGSGSFCNHIER